MSEILIFSIMEGNLTFSKMEDNPIFIKNGRQPNIVIRNGRQPFYFKNEGDLKINLNER